MAAGVGAGVLVGAAPAGAETGGTDSGSAANSEKADNAAESRSSSTDSTSSVEKEQDSSPSKVKEPDGDSEAKPSRRGRVTTFRAQRDEPQRHFGPSRDERHTDTDDTDDEQTAQGTAIGVDREGDALTSAVVRPPNSGTVNVDATGGAFVYSPGNDGAQADSFSVVVDDWMGGGTRTGVVMFDGVALDDALVKLGDAPVYQIAAPLVTQISPPGNTQAVGTVAVGRINDFSPGEQHGLSGMPGQDHTVDHVTVSVPGGGAELNPFDRFLETVTSTVIHLLFGAPAEAPAGVRVGHSGLELADDVTVDADWYFPDAEPTGVIYLQHGFLRSKTNVSALAGVLAQQTNSIVVAPTLSSNFLGNDPYWINGPAAQGAVARLFAGDRVALSASAAAAGYTGVLPASYVLAGHSAGGNLVTAAGGLTGRDPRLKGIVLLDAVDRGGDMARGLAGLAGVPVYQIAAEPCLCNVFGSGTAALVGARPGQIVGVQLVGGSHVDAEGVSTGLLAGLACGFSRAGNPTAVQSIAAGWISDMLNGTSTGVYLDAGERLEVGRAVAVGPGHPTGISRPTADLDRRVTK